MEKQKILFICVHNSARSQMAEAFVNRMGGDRFEAESAGLEPTEINPLVVEAMREEGIDLAGKAVKSVFDLYRQGRLYKHVVTVCDESAEAKCPVFPGVAFREHWPFPDPAEVAGTPEEKLAKVREIREAVKERVRAYLERFPE